MAIIRTLEISIYESLNLPRFRTRHDCRRAWKSWFFILLRAEKIVKGLSPEEKQDYPGHCRHINKKKGEKEKRVGARCSPKQHNVTAIVLKLTVAGYSLAAFPCKAFRMKLAEKKRVAAGAASLYPDRSQLQSTHGPLHLLCAQRELARFRRSTFHPHCAPAYPLLGRVVFRSGYKLPEHFSSLLTCIPIVVMGTLH